MTNLTDNEKMAGWEIRKQFGKWLLSNAGLGYGKLGYIRPGRNQELLELWMTPGVYQVRHGKKGQYTYRLPFYNPHQPRTIAQQANKAKFAAAVAAWEELTVAQKARYNKEGKKRQLYGRNLFLSRYLK